MFQQKIKLEIENVTSDIMQNNEFIQYARKGQLTKNQIIRYLKNIDYSISYTPIHLKAASYKAQEQGLFHIAKFMEGKYNDEFGHDSWVKQDIQSLGANLEDNQTETIKITLTKNIQNLIFYVESLATSKPLNYMAYITFLEYFTVLAAPEFLACVEKKCGIPKSSLSVIVKHGELDKIHAEDNLCAISKFIDTSEKNSEFLKVIHMSASILNRHFTECAEAV
jgi:pyrroloquinoline quinone (PQQ) biosynthesis protein C